LTIQEYGVSAVISSVILVVSSGILTGLESWLDADQPINQEGVEGTQRRRATRILRRAHVKEAIVAAAAGIVTAGSVEIGTPLYVGVASGFLVEILVVARYSLTHQRRGRHPSQ
jgi:hypothetical protein